jgi:hypothetical protein
MRAAALPLRASGIPVQVCASQRPAIRDGGKAVMEADQKGWEELIGG